MGIEKTLPGIKKNILLKEYTSFKIGGRAKYFFEAKKKEDLLKAVITAKKLALPFFVLGGGSNLLVSDKGYNGLVIKCQMSNTEFPFMETRGKKRTKFSSPVKCQNQNSKLKTIYVEVGTPLALLVREAAKNSLSGLEWAAGIPGTVGGAIFGNAGAFGKSIGDLIEEVEVLDSGTEKIKILSNRDCKFSYRESLFKENKNLIILSANLQLKKEKKSEIERKIKEYLDYRRETQPLNFPSAGSVFKNPLGFSAGDLIERCGLKGKRIGDVKISEKHANFIINLGNGRASDVKKLINLIKKSAKKKFKIVLEEEVQFLGF